jgi:hypothetical protein
MEPTQRVQDILNELKQKGLISGDNKLMSDQVRQESKKDAEEIVKAVQSGNQEELFNTIKGQQEVFRNSVNMRLVEMQNQIDALKNEIASLKSRPAPVERVEREERQAPPEGYRPSTDVHEIEQARQENQGQKSTADPTYSQRRGNFKPGDIDIRDIFNYGKKK